MSKALLPLLLLVFLPTSLFGQLHQWDGQNSGDNFGGALSIAGDVNGDGFDDLIIGASGFDPSGSAYVYSGVNGALLYQWQNGQTSSDTFGESVSAAGDVNGDGFDDLIIGASKSGNSGSAYVYSGVNGALLYQWDGGSAGDGLGGSVSGAGDLNGDGIPDVVVGAQYTHNNNRGSAYAYSGADGALLYEWTGEGVAIWFGSSVSGAGDVNGDGFEDVIVGARLESAGGLLYSGAAYVYSGVNGALIYTWGGQNPSDHLGCAVSGAGDTNGDGIDELLIGAYGSDNNGSSSGSAYIYEVSTFYSTTDLFAGDPIPAVFTIAGAAPNSSVTLGYSFAGAGPFTTVFGIVDMTPPINTLAVLSADANGDASWVVNVPPSAHGRTLYTQALNTGLLTNSLAIEIN